MKPWLGAQEAHYAGLTWHLNVPSDYLPQVNGHTPNAQNIRVFPGKSMVNVDISLPNLAGVSLTGFVDAWITDMECATSCKPKMYGFDFARVSEVYDDGAGKRLILEKSPSDRANHGGHAGEHSMMKDLMISTLAEGGEVCLTYHMFNPFLPQITTQVTGDKVGSALSLRASDVTGAFGAAAGTAVQGKDLGSVDIVNSTAANVVSGRNIIRENYERLGDFLKQVLRDPLTGNKAIYLRLLHEPNIGYFWWGQPQGAATATYYSNFRKFWNFLVTTIRGQLEQGQQQRLKFVFSINGEQSPSDLVTKLDDYFPTPAAAGPFDADTTAFLDSISVIGLDYYEDWVKDPAASNLIGEYVAVKTKVDAIKTRHGLTIEHALTEVSVRTNFKGKLYGKYAGQRAWKPNKRHYFNDAVFELVRLHQPKWVLFWVNRVGNAVIDSFAPSTTAQPSGAPALFYHAQTNVFDSDYAELYYPIYPNEPFYIETYSAGDDSGSKSFFKISGTDAEALANIPGAIESGKPTKHGIAYRDAMIDFFNLVPIFKRKDNRKKFKIVSDFLDDDQLPRPDLEAPAQATQAERDAALFEALE